MSGAPLIGRGGEVAGWFNTRARRVTEPRVDAFRAALPDARVYAASTFEEAEAHAQELVNSPPRILFCGGGDGTVVALLNSLRTQGATTFPLIGLFKLGTGNGWPSAVGARRYEKELVGLTRLSLEPPRRQFQLCEVEGKLCQFAGVGWDATLLNDYRRNLEARQQQLVAGGVASRLSKGLGGYLYSLFRITVPEEIGRAREGRTQLTVENLGEPALTFDAKRQRVLVPASQATLYAGPMSIGAAGIEPYWGSRFMAFPYAQAVPGRMNFRVYDRHVLEGVNNMFNLWGGRALRGMHDWWVTGVRLRLSRPMPFQVGGDVMGTREVIDFTMARETVELIDWAAVTARAS